MKQTAVEWLVEQIIKEKGLVDLDIQAAKEMEKEQMRLADKNGQDRNQYKHDYKYGGVEYWDNEPKPFEEYYNETYGGNK